MWQTTAMDPLYIDRRGCGDELDLDQSFKAAQWLGSLAGSERFEETDYAAGDDDVFADD